jgi:hypothetical protein
MGALLSVVLREVLRTSTVSLLEVAWEVFRHNTRTGPVRAVQVVQLSEEKQMFQGMQVALPRARRRAAHLQTVVRAVPQAF